MKKKLQILFLVLSIFIITTSYTSGNSQSIHAVAAVNDVEISLLCFERELQDYQDHFEKNFTIDFHSTEGEKILHQIKVNILKSLILEELIVQAAQELGLTVSDEEIKADLVEFKKTINEENVSELFGPNVRYDEKALYEDTRIVLFHRKLQDYLFQGEVTEAEILAYYQTNHQYFADPERIRASQILVTQEEQAYQIHQELLLGADFARLAQKYSICTSAASGGDVGFFTRGQVLEEFENVAFSLKAGEISLPFKTRSGWHIIKITDICPATTYPIEMFTSKIHETILLSKKDAVTQTYLQAKLKNSKIVYFVDFGFEINFD